MGQPSMGLDYALRTPINAKMHMVNQVNRSQSKAASDLTQLGFSVSLCFFARSLVFLFRAFYALLLSRVFVE